MSAQRIAQRLAQRAHAHNEYIESRAMVAVCYMISMCASNVFFIPGMIIWGVAARYQRKQRLYAVPWHDFRLLQRPSLLEIEATLERLQGDEKKAESYLLDVMIPNKEEEL
jgi:hypothetical protein